MGIKMVGRLRLQSMVVICLAYVDLFTCLMVEKRKWSIRVGDFWPMAIKTQDLVGVTRGDHYMKNVVTVRKLYMIIGVLHVHWVRP